MADGEYGARFIPNLLFQYLSNHGVFRVDNSGTILRTSCTHREEKKGRNQTCCSDSVTTRNNQWEECDLPLNRASDGKNSKDMIPMMTTIVLFSLVVVVVRRVCLNFPFLRP